MAVSKEDMANITAKLQDAGAIPKNTDGLNEEEQAAQLAAEAASAQKPVVDDAGFVNEAGEKVNEEGQLINEDGSLIEGGDDDGLSDEEKAAAAAAKADAGSGDEGTYTPTELAEAVGWEVAELYESLVIPLDDGQEPVTLGEFKNKFQDLNRDHEAAKQQLETMQDQMVTAQQGGNLQQQMSQDMMQAVGYMQSLDRMEQAVDWAQLEKYEPAEAVLKRQKFQQARQDTKDRIDQIQQADWKQKQTNLAAAKVKLGELIPAWSDPASKKADQEVIRAHMKTVGFVDGEINQIADPRTMTLLKELVDLRAQVAAAKVAVKRVRAAPKVLRGAGGRFQRANQNEVKQNLVTKAKTTGKKTDELAAAKAVLGIK